MKSLSVNKINIFGGFTAGIISGLSYGMNPLFGKPILDKGVDVFSMLFYRYLIAVSLMALYMLIRKINFRVTCRQFFLLIILGALFTSSSVSLFFAYKYIPSGIATTVLYVYPILVALIMMFLGDFPTLRTWICVVTGVAGAIVLSFNSTTGMLDWRGLVLVFISGLTYALFIVIVNQSRAVRAVSSLKITFYSFFFGSIILFFICGCGSSIAALPDNNVVLNTILLALIPTVIATITVAISSKNIGATKTSILGVLEPLTAIIIGTLIFQEPFTPNIPVGIALIIFAVMFLLTSEKKEKKHV